MLVIDDLSVRVAGRLLIDHASARIPTGARVGLVGRNGSGKTTLFRVIAGEIAAEHGTIELPPRCAHRPPGAGGAGRARKPDRRRAARRSRNAAACWPRPRPRTTRIASPKSRRGSPTSARMRRRRAPPRSSPGLGFSAADQARPCSEFSGGWRMRVALAAALFAEPDLLLLDEPTNYLDLEGTLWLQDHLARYPHTVIVISHDRDLLDTAVDWILHLEAGKLTLYRGGYSAFERQRARAPGARPEARQEAGGAAQAPAGLRRPLPAPRPPRRARRSRALKMLAKLEPIAAMVASEVRPIDIPAAGQAAVAADHRARRRRRSATSRAGRCCGASSLRIDDDDRIALLGANGNGKSTLVKLIAGAARADGRHA